MAFASRKMKSIFSFRWRVSFQELNNVDRAVVDFQAAYAGVRAKGD
jgi:hypothetical protein